MRPAPLEHDAHSIEKFAPRLRAGLQRFALGDGDTALLSPDGVYLRVARHLAPLLNLMDGDRTLSALAIEGAAGGRIITTRPLLALMASLSRGGWLANARDELEAVGLPGPWMPTLGERLADALLHVTLGSRRLGSLATALVTPLRALRLRTVGWGVLAGVAAATSAVVFMWAARSLAFYDPLMLHGAYWRGLLAAYLGGVVAMTTRQLARAWVLGSHRAAVHAAGLELRCGLLGPHLDARHIFRAGPTGSIRLALAGVAGSGVGAAALSALALTAANPAAQHTMQLAAAGGVLVLLVCTCPFFATDLGTVIDLAAANGEGRRHALTYLMRRLLLRQGTSELFAGEAHHITVAVAAVVWIYFGLRFSVAATSALILPASVLPVGNLPALEMVALVAVLGLAFVLVLVCVLAFGAGAIRLLTAALPRPRRAPKPLHADGTQAEVAIASNPLFAALTPQARHELARVASFVLFEQGQDVVRQGERGDTFFSIASGEASVIVIADSGVELPVATLRAGDGFGEAALLAGAPRNATVRATARAQMFCLTRDNFVAALEQAGVAPEQVTAMLRASQAIRRSEVFRDMAPGAIARVVGLCQRREFDQGEVLIREGEPGDRFYIIESGSVVVEKKEHAGPVAVLRSGDFFGEIALLSDVPRTATVTCQEPSVLLSLDRERFRQVMAYDFAASARLERVAQKRSA